MLWGKWLALAPPRCGQPVLETSFPTALQRLVFRDGDLGVSPPGNQQNGERSVGRCKTKDFRDTTPWLDLSFLIARGKS
jgi:hypothetical protein